MRIISGIYRGRQFRGKIPHGVRPTADAARESVFNILVNRIDFNGIRILDLFAGAGGMGIEALSRGAGFCCFVEKNRKVCSYLNEVFSQFRIPNDSYKLFNMDAYKFLSSGKDVTGSYDLVFIDPPYKQFSGGKIIRAILEHSILQDNGLLVVEHSSTESVNAMEGFDLITEKKFGATTIEILQQN